MTASAPPPVLVDVTPRALVVETVGGWCDTIVPRNAKIPCERTRAFTTSSDMQTVVRVRVGQGEDAIFGGNTFLGEVELAGLRPAPRGQVTIQVRFEIDESGTLKVYATDIATGREASATLQLVGIAGAASVQAMQTRHAALRVN
jgi:molecular chaperone DnaK